MLILPVPRSREFSGRRGIIQSKNYPAYSVILSKIFPVYPVSG